MSPLVLQLLAKGRLRPRLVAAAPGLTCGIGSPHYLARSIKLAGAGRTALAFRTNTRLLIRAVGFVKRVRMSFSRQLVIRGDRGTKPRTDVVARRSRSSTHVRPVSSGPSACSSVDRASASGAEGRRFESCRARQPNQDESLRDRKNRWRCAIQTTDDREEDPVLWPNRG